MALSQDLFDSNLPNGKKQLFSDGASPLVLKVRNDARTSGFTLVDFGFLRPWLGQDAELFLKAVSIFSHRYSAATPTYAVRRILQHWSEMHKLNNWSRPKETDVAEFEVQLAELRRSFYVAETEKGLALSSTTNKWGLFPLLVEALVISSAIPPIVIGAFLSPPKERDVILGREDAIKGVGMIPPPRNFRPEKDSFNDELFEIISITLSDIDYLDEYTARLEAAILEIKSCALKDFRLLKKKRIEGRRLIKATNTEFLKNINSASHAWRYYDKETDSHFFSTKGKPHPNLLGNILAIVDEEMGGIPKPKKKYGPDGRTVISHSAPDHWRFVQSYGKNNLLPYLGVMTSEAVAICMIILMLEHPALNATSLYRARLEDDDGKCILLSSAGGQPSQRLTVNKPRANSEKSVILSGLAREVISSVLEWTAPVRLEMRAQGRIQESRKLWVGISILNYDLIAYSEKAIIGSLRTDNFRKRGAVAFNSRGVAFVDRHPSLEPWGKKINFKALRVNAGVLAYLRSDGNLVEAAKVFGHKNVRTTIENYIPRALRQAIYERQIRRHQNALITFALEDEHIMLKTSDFRTVEELHEFLKSSNSALLGLEEEWGGKRNPRKMTSYASDNSRVVLCDDPDALAVAMLYRDSLERASQKFINRPDLVTGVKPKFWMDFVDSLLSPLPLSMAEFSELVKKAILRKPVVALSLSLPEVC